jgi:iron-sulfur cluster assembly protein
MNKLLKITPSALKILESQNSKKFIEFGVKSGGCSGFQYYFNPCDKKPNKEDEIIEFNNLKIKICDVSLLHIIGTEIDWKEDIMGNRFVFINPNASVKCGCGSSFG